MKPRSAVDQAVRLLARRAHGRGELGAKLRARGYPSAEIEAAFTRLAELGYLESEAELAERYAAELARKRGATPRVVGHRLRARGFGAEEVDGALARAFADWDPRVAALETVGDETDARKAAGLLTRRGFTADTVAWVVMRLERADRAPDPTGPPARRRARLGSAPDPDGSDST